MIRLFEQQENRIHVDWLTLTAKQGLEWLYLQNLYRRLVGVYSSAGHKERAFKFGGYEASGYPFMSFGVRDDGCILVSKGEAAELVIRDYMPVYGRASRVDVALDVTLKSPNPRWGEESSRLTSKGVRIGKFLYYPTYIRSFEGGETCYWGSRRGRFLLRLYDKGALAQSADEGVLWRLEVQLNREAAQAFMETVRTRPLDLSSVCKSVVLAKFVDVGIITNEGFDLALAKLDYAVSTYEPERTLSWIRTSVRPAIERLIMEGLENQVREATGLFKQTYMFDEVIK